ncbi:hypothetical protein [Streptomyces prasinus]
MKSKGEELAAVVALVTLLVASIWIWTSAPCGLWSWAKAGDVPARCINK